LLIFIIVSNEFKPISTSFSVPSKLSWGYFSQFGTFIQLAAWQQQAKRPKRLKLNAFAEVDKRTSVVAFIVGGEQ